MRARVQRVASVVVSAVWMAASAAAPQFTASVPARAALASSAVTVDAIADRYLRALPALDADSRIGVAPECARSRGASGERLARPPSEMKRDL